jgi:hypothetical protein
MSKRALVSANTRTAPHRVRIIGGSWKLDAGPNGGAVLHAVLPVGDDR